MAKNSRSTDLAWAAGITDGEGCLYISNTTSQGHPAYTLYLQIKMCHKGAIEQFAKISSGRAYQKEMTPSGRKIWKCTLAGRKAADFLREMLPFLTVKKAEAKVAIKFQPDDSRKGRRRYTLREIARCKRARARLQNLKKAK